MKATFFQRAIAYIIDALIISVILGIVTLGVKTNDTKLEEKYNNLYDNFSKGEITSSEYINEYYDILYETQKTNKISNSLNIVILIGYFIVFQYLNKGQTIGKKLFKIKIVTNDKKDITLSQMLIRGLMIYSLISGTINVLLLFNIPKKIYMTSYLLFGGIESIIILLSAIFILYRNDKRALHDIASKSIVIIEK